MIKRLSSRAITLITNCVLVAIIVCVGVVCLVPAASEAALVPDDVYYKGRSERGVSLVFNVYWGTEEVKSILNVLDEYSVKATFFIGGCWADDNVQTVREIASRGHEIGTHGYFHRDHQKLSYSQNVEEIKTSAQFLRQVTGGEVTLFAPPSGAYGDDTVRAARSLGLKTVLWSKDTIDWRDKDASVCLRRATEEVSGGDIILMHPMAHTLEALPQILQNYQDRGLQAITVSENLFAGKAVG